MLKAHPWVALATLIGAQTALLLILRDLKHRRRLHAELSRKLMHVALGLSLFACPFLFDRLWPVLVLTGTAVLVIAVMRWLPVVKQRFGDVVGGVARGSWGDFLFPLSGAALYAITNGDVVLYGIPILILTFADAAAALIGVSYGRNRLAGADKTVEGSLAFFLAAFFAAHVPLLLWSTVGRAESLAIALIVGLLAMMLEAVSTHGSDNVFIPLGGYLLLRAFVGMSAARLSVALGVVLLMGALVLVLRHRRSLNDAGILAAVLVGFLVWTAGGWRWVVPPLVFFLAYSPLWPRRSLLRHRPHDVVSTVTVASAGLVWLFLAVVFEEPALYYPYTLAFALHLTFIGINWHRIAQHHARRRTMLARSVAAGWLVMFLPFVAVMRGTRESLVLAALAPVVLAIGGAAYLLFVRSGRGEAPESYPWTRQALLGAGASALGLAALLSFSVR